MFGGRHNFVEIWMPAACWRAAARYAYCFVGEYAAQNPAPFICAALDVAAPGLVFELLPSSHGAMLLCFLTIADRDYAIARGPVVHQGSRLELVRSSETSNRFLRVPEWLAYLSVRDFPLEHWFPANISAAFRSFGTVAEIDPLCLSGYDFSSLRLTIELHHPRDIPKDVWLMSPDGGGCVMNVNVVRVWPLAAQLDGDGNLMPFFQYPPPPPPLQHQMPQLPGPQGPPPPAPPQQGAPAPAPPELPGTPAPPHATPAAVVNTLCAKMLMYVTSPLSPFPSKSFRFPLVISLTRIYAADCSAKLRALPWYAARAPPPAADPRAVSPQQCSAAGLPAAAPVRARRARLVGEPQRQSARLAAEAPATFVHSTDKAMQLTKLKNSLASCSKELKAHVNKKGLLGKQKKHISILALRKLASAAGLGGTVAQATAVVARPE